MFMETFTSSYYRADIELMKKRALRSPAQRDLVKEHLIDQSSRRHMGQTNQQGTEQSWCLVLPGGSVKTCTRGLKNTAFCWMYTAYWVACTCACMTNTAGKQHHAKELLSFGAHQRVAALGLHTVADFSNLFSPQIEGRNMATSVHLCSP